MCPLTSYQQLKVRVQLVRDSPAKTLPKIQLDSSQNVYDLLNELKLNYTQKTLIPNQRKFFDNYHYQDQLSFQ